MEFTGTVHFNFDSYDVWRIYTVLIRASQDKNVSVGVEWRAFTNDDLATGAPDIRALAACEAVRVAYPENHEKFVRALLTLVYQERDKPGTDKTLAVAAHVASIDAAAVLTAADGPGLAQLESAVAEARERGVSDVPTIERHGPPVLIKTNAAANHGSAAARLRLIDHMLRDDGIWEMTKP